MGNAAAAAAAAAGAAIGAEADPPAATLFALTPVAAHSDVLDYTRREHTKIYDAVTAPLEGDKFDGTLENLANFLARLREKANNFMWMNSICKIKIADGPPATFRNLMDDYGNITLSQVQANATPYVNQQV
jgi:translation initiation factor IF-1